MRYPPKMCSLNLARSRYIGHSQKSQMEATVVGAGTVSFWWKVSSESGCDELEFYLDNTLKHAISGEADWAQKSYNITGAGTHTLKWRYYKDGSVDEGDDRGWVDYVQWSGYVASDPTLVPTVWETITYTYDPAGRRIAKAYDGTTVVKYLYDGDHCLAEYGGSDQLLRKYVYGPGVDQPVCLIETAESNAAYYYHFDGLGSVVALSNAAGSTVQLYEYSVYGQVAASDPNHPNRFLFTAREFDVDTGLYYYRARYYHPEIGRFLQTDPIGQAMNPYVYCSNDPTNRVDPSGLFYVPEPSRGSGYQWPTGEHFQPTGRIIVLPFGVTPDVLDRYASGLSAAEMIHLAGQLLSMANLAGAICAGEFPAALGAVFDITYEQLVAGPMLESIEQTATDILAVYGWVVGGDSVHKGFFEVKITKDGEPAPEYRWVEVQGIVGWDDDWDGWFGGYFGADSYGRAYMAAYLGLGYYSWWLTGDSPPSNLRDIDYVGWYEWSGDPIAVGDTRYFDPISPS